MIEFSADLVWGALQVTLFASIVALAVFCLRRWFAGILGDALSITMGLIIVCSLLAFVPISGWLSLPTAANQTGDSDLDQNSISVAARFENEPAAPSNSSTSDESDWVQSISNWWVDLQRGGALSVDSTTQSQANSNGSWLSTIAVLLILCVGIGVIRLLIGLQAIGWLRSQCAPVQDPRVERLVVRLSEQLNVTKDIEVFESSELTTAATVGFIRPVILLPCDWTHWNEDQLSSALAHELAHVAGHDFIKNLIAQTAVAFNFYNPLVHWLGRELRVSQELIADDRAALANGGKQLYLLTMAEMALQQENQTLGWLAQPFLPTRTTFLRRIEMLKGENRKSMVANHGAIWLARVAIIAIALVCIGLRIPVEQKLSAQAPDSISDAFVAPVTNNDWDKFAFVSDQTQFFISVDLNVLREINQMDEVLQQLNWDPAGGALFFDLTKASSFTFQFHHEQDGKAHAGFVVHSNVDLPDIVDVDGEPFVHRGQACVENGGVCLHFVDSRTAVIAMTRTALISMLDFRNGPRISFWKEKANTLKGHAIVGVVSELGFESAPEKLLGPNQGTWTMFSPLWKDTQYAVAGCTPTNESVRLKLLAKTKQGKQQTVSSTLTSLFTLLGNSLKIAEPDPNLAEFIKFGSDLLESHEITAADDTIEVNFDMIMNKGQLGHLLATMVTNLRNSARKVSGMNNLRQVALAMHNYHDAYGHLPAASITAPGSEHPHSWRVAILPFIEQGELYKRYRLDEPWNSEHNLNVTKKMPDIYRHPDQEKASTDSSIYVFTGEGTPFEKGKVTKLETISDGTSNTILAVQAKSKTHWAQPSDFEFTANQSQQILEGLRNNDNLSAAFCDGSVHLLGPDVDGESFRKLIHGHDGEVFQLRR